MTPSHIFEGKDVDEALKEAKRSLNLNTEDIEFRILDSGRTRMFGIKSSKAKIAVSLPETPDENKNWEEWLRQEIDDQDVFDIRLPSYEQKPKKSTEGKAWIQAGELFFHETAEKKPILIVSKDLPTYNHKNQITGRHVLRNGDEISFDLDTELIETKWTLKVNEKKQIVELTVTPGKLQTTALADHSISSILEPKVVFHSHVNNQLQETDIYKQLSNMQVTEGIDHEVIKQACQSEEEHVFTVARGTLPEDGKHGEISFRIDIQEKSVPFTEKHDGTVDFRESLYIPSVEHGEILAEVIDPLPGQDGVSVFGDVLNAKDGEPVILKTGSGVEVNEEENIVVATQSGRPRIKQTSRLVKMSILPKKLHQGDLSIKHGNIRFLGDVEVTGFVNEGMTIEGEGAVRIHKGTINSALRSQHSITVGGNIISSVLTAGKNESLFSDLHGDLTEFLSSYRPFLAVLTQLTESSKFKEVYDVSMGLGPMIKRLAENKFPDLLSQVNALVETISEKKHMLDPQWDNFAGNLHQKLLTFYKQSNVTLDSLEGIEQQAEKLLETADNPVTSECPVHIGYAMNSQVYSTGNITVDGKGAVHSELTTEGRLDISGRLIGGTVYAGKGISIETAGSPSGVKTFIKVPEDGVIEIIKAHEDTVLRIGHAQRIISKPESMIRAKLNHESQIELH